MLRALSLQAVAAAIAALVGAATLFPGALTPGWRHAVLTRSAAGFTEAEWLDEVLPADTVVASASRFRAFNPRPFVVLDAVLMAQGARDDEILLKLVVEGGVTHLVVDDPHPAFMRLSRRCGQAVTGPKQFKLATRNPFSADSYQAQVFRLTDCATR